MWVVLVLLLLLLLRLAYDWESHYFYMEYSITLYGTGTSLLSLPLNWVL